MRANKRRRPRREGFREIRERVQHNVNVEQKKTDHDINSARRMLMTLCAEEDVGPLVALDASLSLAAQLVKIPPPDSKRHGWWFFMRRAWRAWRFTKVQAEQAEEP